jgi:hypothetical protein
VKHADRHHATIQLQGGVGRRAAWGRTNAFAFVSRTAASGANDAISRRPLSRAFRPFIRPTLEGPQRVEPTRSHLVEGTVAKGGETRNSNYTEIGKSRIGPNSVAAKLNLKADTEAPARIANEGPVLDASECAPHWMRPQPRASEFLKLVLQLFVALVVGIIGLQLAATESVSIDHALQSPTRQGPTFRRRFEYQVDAAIAVARAHHPLPQAGKSQLAADVGLPVRRFGVRSPEAAQTNVFRRAKLTR